MPIEKKYKLAILNNQITPYRIPIYKGLGNRYSTYLLLSGEESTRNSWDNAAFADAIPNVNIRSVWGVTLKFIERRRGEDFDPRYLHINPGYFWELLKIRPDVLISAEMGFRSLIALLYGFLFKKPVWILWGGTLHTERNRGRIKRLIRNIVFSRVTRWISYGETTTEYLLHLGIENENILQIQNCIDETLFTQSQSPALELSPAPVLLYAGQIIKRKGVAIFLRAAAILQQEGHEFSILIVGNGPDKPNILRLINELELKNVTVLPAHTPSEMPSIYQSADVFVFPTLEEVWGLVVNEALWSGLTVASSTYAGCAQEIVPRENIFDPLEISSVVNILKKAVQGQLSMPNVDYLMTASTVVEMISAEIENDVFSNTSEDLDKKLSASI